MNSLPSLLPLLSLISISVVLCRAGQASSFRISPSCAPVGDDEWTVIRVYHSHELFSFVRIDNTSDLAISQPSGVFVLPSKLLSAPGLHSIELCFMNATCSVETLLMYEQPPVLLGYELVMEGDSMLLHLEGFGFMSKCGDLAARCKLGDSIVLNVTVLSSTRATCHGTISERGKFLLSFASDGQHFDALVHQPIIVELPEVTASQSSIRWWWLLAAVPTSLAILGCIAFVSITECVRKRKARYAQEMELSSHGGRAF